MCLKKILEMFSPQNDQKVTSPETPTVLPHPEEPVNEKQTVANAFTQMILQKWLTDWNVPSEYWDFWKTRIKLTVYDTWPAECLALGIKIDTPAYAIELNGIRQLNSLAKWLNPGVIAHEQAHNSYALLTNPEKEAFSTEYKAVKGSDPYIVLLYSLNNYGLQSDIEGHAEVYRYIGDKMPGQLKKYYPKLF
jgi:hypothetical protein